MSALELVSVRDITDPWSNSAGVMTKLYLMFYDAEEDVFFGGTVAVSDELVQDPGFDFGPWLAARGRYFAPKK